MIYTTLNRIRVHSPCKGGWEKLLSALGKTKADDEPLSLLTILDSNGIDDALWCFRAEPQHSRLYRMMAIRFVREVQTLMKDQRSLDALDVAERHAKGEATDQELAAVWAAAWDAARAAVWAAAWAAELAAIWAAELDAELAAAWDAARTRQAEIFSEMVTAYESEQVAS